MRNICIFIKYSGIVFSVECHNFDKEETKHHIYDQTNEGGNADNHNKL